MTKISIVVDSFFNSDRLFDSQDPVSNRDGCLNHLILFKQQAQQRGYEVHTADLLSPQEADYTFYFEMPANKPVGRCKNFLFLWEPEVVCPENWDFRRHVEFDRVFTWRDDLIGLSRYVKINPVVPFPTTLDWQAEKTGILTQISGNKIVFHKNELYSERVRSIRWWEKHHPNDFRFYGVGWGTPTFGPRLWLLNRFKVLRMLLPSFKNWGGRVAHKIDVLKNYKFSLCYENSAMIPGYITEKIFDCFFAGTVPIYWGPENVAAHIPSSCFINRNKFSSDAELYKHLNGISERGYEEIRQRIREYLDGEKVREFSADFFCDTVFASLNE